MKLKKLREGGDTIVEVLLVIAIISFVLAISATTANRSMRGAQQSQERAEALKLAESQLEILKNFGVTALGSETLFCFTLSPVGLVTTGWSAPSADPATDTPAGYPAACRTGIDNRYRMFVTRTMAEPTLFRARVRWDKLGGGVEEVSLYYGVYR